MGNKFKKKKNLVKLRLRAKLSFDEGYAENPIYSIKAFTNEKNRGIDMIELIKNNFHINKEDINLAFKKKMEEWQEDFQKPTIYSKEVEKTLKKIEWTRDEKGNIISPFSIKKKQDSFIK